MVYDTLKVVGFYLGWGGSEIGLGIDKRSEIAGVKVTGRNVKKHKQRLACIYWGKAWRNYAKLDHTEQESQLHSLVRRVSPTPVLQSLGRHTAAHASDQGEGSVRSETLHIRNTWGAFKMLMPRMYPYSIKFWGWNPGIRICQSSQSGSNTWQKLRTSVRYFKITFPRPFLGGLEIGYWLTWYPGASNQHNSTPVFSWNLLRNWLT